MVTNKASAASRRHPSQSRILTLLNGSATGRKARDVREHLKSCLRCNKFAEESGKFLTEISTCARIDEPRTGTNKPDESRVGWVLHRKWASVVAIGTAFFIAASSVPDGIPQVRADELLARAQGSQETHSGKAMQLNQLYRARMESGDTTCQVAHAGWQLVAGHANGECEELHRTLLGANWSADDPLSVRWYRKWRDSLAHRHDSLVRGELYSVVRTETSQGAIAAASLRVFSSDYRPVELRLELADSRAISVEAYNSPSPGLSTSAPVDTSTTKSNLLDAGQVSRLDRMEVRAWQALHELGADSGWEAAVTRTPKSVVVINAIPDVHRREKLRDILHAGSEPNLAIQDIESKRSPTLSIWPQRPVSGNSIPLAEGILEARYADASERSRFVTSISAGSKNLVGLAFERERLRERRAALHSCPCALDLDALMRDTQGRLARELHAESQLLSEVLGAIPPSTSDLPLSYREARQIDAALESLFSAARESSRQQRDRLIQTIRRLVSSRQSSL
jgi:hypothetical protein